ncbi:MAG: PilN domain-containing protein [Synechococcaceae cyanobacterium]|nr:PilN domain-containing protein [Synechococcaceae cyanobacterium]
MPRPPVLDLLRERRRELGLDSMAGLLGERRRLVWRGSLIGAALLGAMALITALVALRHRFIQAEIQKLAPMEEEVKRLTQEGATREAALSKLTTTNREVATTLTTVRTSSALLAELQLRTPQGVQLSSAMVKGSQLELKGKADDPLAFARINAYLLELKRSDLFDANSVTLVRSERMNQPNQASPGLRLPGQPVSVSFGINATFATLSVNEQLLLLERLRSEGMARRLQLLQKEGLLP